MTTAQYIAGGIGLLVILGPMLWKAAEWTIEAWFSEDGNHKPAALVGPTFEQAVSDLSKVRLRLIQTGKIGDGEKAAIDCLTLALVAGSEK